MRCCLLGITAAVALGSASTARAEVGHGHEALEAQFEGASAPPPSDVLALTGAALLGFAYTDSVFVALLSGRGSDEMLYIPVAGPWLDLAQRDCTAHPCSVEWLSASLLVVDGVSQGAGAGLMIASLFVPDEPLNVRIGDARVRVLPARVGAAAYGLLVDGAF